LVKAQNDVVQESQRRLEPLNRRGDTNKCITTSVKRLQPTLWFLHNVVLCL